MRAEAGAREPPAAAPPAAPRPAAALPWLRVPITFQAGSGAPLEEVDGLPPALRDAIRTELGFTELFPVQAAVWRELAGGAGASHDACVCAPTGSGKTLAYALPLLCAAAAARPPAAAAAAAAAAGAPPAPRRVLLGLVVVPTRDLAAQVHKTLAALAPSLGLAAGLAAARESVAAEAAAAAGRPAGAGSGCDILVATPGRLMAHIQGTPGFTLGHVRMLVVDETDRLLRQDYQNWLPAVLAQLPPAPPPATPAGAAPRAPRPPGGRAPLLPLGGAPPRRAVKLAVSATLTRDPSKLSRLDLHCPRFISMRSLGGRRYALPGGLSLSRVLAPAQHKPLALAALLARLRGVPTLVFASSVETTHRLYLLLAALPGLPERAVEYAGRMPPAERAANLEAFRSGAARVLVASDAMARGMDVDCVGAVINYDAPAYPKVFVHRAGRTARAGREGQVFTLLRPQDMRHFKAMAAKLSLPNDERDATTSGGGANTSGGGGGGGAVGKEVRIPQEELRPLRPALAAALRQVQALLAAEGDQDGAAAPRGGGGGGGAAAAAAAARQEEVEAEAEEEEEGPAAAEEEEETPAARRREAAGPSDRQGNRREAKRRKQGGGGGA